jgi:hypothetical protein
VVNAADPSAGPVRGSLVATARGILGSAAAAQVYVNFIADAPKLTVGQREVLAYVTAHAPGARIQLGVELGSWGADPYLLNSSARVVSFGGYIGLDPAPTVPQLSDWASSGQLGYVLFPGALLQLGRAGAARGRTSAGSGSASLGAAALSQRIAWIVPNCKLVPPGQVGPFAAQAGVLFDCRGR